jgi:two-component system chemotaxis sensor kinase CheA
VLRACSLETDAARIEYLLDSGLNDQSGRAIVGAITRALGTQTADAELTAAPRTDASTRVLRIDAERVNALVSLTGELGVAMNAIAHIAKLAEEEGNRLASVLQIEQLRLSRLVTDLKYSVLNLRVLPLRTVFQRFSRVVREMAVSLEKPASLVTEGDDTEADKVIVEMLFEPLLHIVRNAMDHGIEPAAARAAAGKPVVATIRLRAYRQGEHVVVEISDDGRGINVARVRAVAAERRIAAEDVLAAMNDSDVTNLIFAPGFSTAGTVTNLSGRGVGMDAVRTAVERIGGRVTIESIWGQGSTVRFVLPFSIMMTRVMTVEAGGQMFGIPLDAVVETVRVPRARIQAIGEAAAFVLRNRTVPLVDLAATLGRQRTGIAQAEATVVVTSVAGELGGLEVDRLGERFDAMLKPVDGLLAGMAGIAGTTLLGDGRVLLVLDLQEILA